MQEECHLCFSSSEIIFFKVKACLHLFKWNFLNKRKKNLLICKNVIQKHVNCWNFVSCELYRVCRMKERTILHVWQYCIIKLYWCLSCHYNIKLYNSWRRVFYMHSSSKPYKLGMVESALLTLSTILCLIRKINRYRRLSLRGGTVVNKEVYRGWWFNVLLSSVF